MMKIDKFDSEDVVKDSLAGLREQLSGKAKDGFQVGTVIRWLSAGKYHYGALKSGDCNWYLTGGQQYYGSGKKSYEELIEVLKRSDVSDVLVSELWREV